ncbi:MAG: AAA family ATPase [Pyrinomonadaceae bacterium]
MKLIVIHGPPAVGKLTVANAVAERTGFKVFHNHLTIDCTRPVFEFGTEAFWQINVRLRCVVIAEAARRGIDLIHTFCYGRGPDDAYFRELVSAATDNGGTVHAVLLDCRDDVRRERIVEESRLRLRKLTDPAAVVDRSKQRFELTSPHPDLEHETLRIDTSDISPDDAARLIIRRFALAEIAQEG